MAIITRADISGALKVLNANEIKDRKSHLEKMLSGAHSPKDVAKVISDLKTYPEWSARLDLEATEPDPAAEAVPKKRKKK